MNHYTRQDIDKMEKIFRLNLINSCTGYKSANLIGTQSADGKTNLAVFSSITHLGSNPPLIGFVLRPTTVPRDSYRNIKASSLFTVNHIHHDTVADAHHTSAKYPENNSQFSKTDFEPEYIDGFQAPFVKDAKVRLACRFRNEYHIQENNAIKQRLVLTAQPGMSDGQWLAAEKKLITCFDSFFDTHGQPESKSEKKLIHMF